MRARADVPEPFDRRAMPGKTGARPPEEILVERAGAGVDVAAGHVRVESLDVRRRERDSVEDRRLEVRRVRRDPRLDTVGVAVTQLLRPRAVARIERAGR